MDFLSFLVRPEEGVSLLRDPVGDVFEGETSSRKTSVSSEFTWKLRSIGPTGVNPPNVGGGKLKVGFV